MTFNPSGKPSLPAPPEGEPLIDAVCLIPEIKPPMLYEDADRHGTDIRLGELLTAFSRRFAAPFMVSVRDGLLPVGDPYAYCGQQYADLSADARNAFLFAIHKQLTAPELVSKSVVCLCGGVLTQGMRRTGLSFSLPVAAMSKSLRRLWIERHVPLSTEVLLNKLFGRPVVQATATRPTSNTKKGTPTVGV